jgi:aminopeptidase N
MGWNKHSIRTGKAGKLFCSISSRSEFFTQAAGMARRSIEFFSNTMPGVVYPYPQITVFNGDGGMEFPMIVNDGDFKNLVNDVYVTTHEIAHMYFPFYVSTNETRFAWIDEGMAYFLPWDLQIELSDYDHRTRAAVGYSNWANNEFDLPLMIPSYASRNPHLGLMSYYKPALAFEIIQNALGKELFSKALKEFISRWNGKHPTPYDFFYTFENVSGRDLSWLIKPWFFERGIPDLAIKEVITDGNKIRIAIEKIGELPTPIDLTIHLENDVKINLTETVNIWGDGKDSFWLEAEITLKPISVELANKNIPDSNLLNNKFEIN